MTWARDHARRCEGLGPDGDVCDCREEVRWDPLTRRYLCRWCWSRVDPSEWQLEGRRRAPRGRTG